MISLGKQIAGDQVERKNVGEKVSHQARNPVDDVIRAALELVRELMLNGTASTPILDPFFIEYLLVNFESADARYCRFISLKFCKVISY